MEKDATYQRKDYVPHRFFQLAIPGGQLPACTRNSSRATLLGTAAWPSPSSFYKLTQTTNDKDLRVAISKWNLKLLGNKGYNKENHNLYRQKYGG